MIYDLNNVTLIVITVVLLTAIPMIYPFILVIKARNEWTQSKLSKIKTVILISFCIVLFLNIIFIKICDYGYNNKTYKNVVSNTISSNDYVNYAKLDSTLMIETYTYIDTLKIIGINFIHYYDESIIIPKGSK